MAWDDDEQDFNEDPSADDNERMDREMRRKDRKLHKHPLYLKADEIFKTVHTMQETIEDDSRKMYMRTLLESAMMLAPKFAGAVTSESWLICMQNAAIMRYHAQYIHTSTSMLSQMTGIPKEYVAVLRSEMEDFRKLFKAWVKTFDKLADEDVNDEWGLFKRD
jgi:hypothetical protein